MDQFRKMLQNVEDSYSDFVHGIISYVKIPGNEYKQILIENFIQNHPEADTSEISRFVYEETDFWGETKERRAV